MERATNRGYDVALIADRDSLNRMLVGDIRPENGTAEDVARFFSYFDPPLDISTIRLILR